ncbi:restriction endonuclease subunit S [Clostridium sp. DL1XJH146]
MGEIKYRSEEEMKDSGIEWLENQPKDWKVKKLKYVTASVKNGIWGEDKKENIHDIPCIRITNFNRNKNTVDMNNITIRNLNIYKQRTYLLNKNDLLIEKSGGGEKQPVGFVCIYKSSTPSIYANFMAKIDVKNENDNKYLLYYFRCLYNKRVNMKHVNQTTGIQNINTTSYFEEKIVLANKSEQQKIVNFLHVKTAQFDSIISKKEKLIEKLEEAKKSLISEVVTGKVKIVDGELVERKPEEMKDSGIEWLGMIPREWGVKRLGFLFSFKNGVNADASMYGYGTKFINVKEVINNEILNYEEITSKVNISKSAIVENKVIKGDILLNRTSETREEIGLSTVYIGNEEVVFGGFVIRGRDKNDELTIGFKKYFLDSYESRKQIILYSSGSIRKNIGQNSLKNVFITYPEIEEQDKISEFLSIKIELILASISNIKSQIQKLTQAKQSLISEAVTGKIDLRDWEIIKEGEVQ